MDSNVKKFRNIFTLFYPKLHVVELRIDSVLPKELFVVSALYDAVFVSTRIFSALRMVERRWAITNVVRPAASFSRDSCTIHSLSLSRAEVASSRMMMAGSSETPGNADALLLTAGELHAPLAHVGIIAVLQFHDKFMSACPLGRLDHFLLRSAGPAVRNVLIYGAGEQIDILLYDTMLRRRLFKVKRLIFCPSKVMSPSVTS